MQAEINPLVAFPEVIALEYREEFRLFTRSGELGQQDRNVIGEVISGDCYKIRDLPTVGQGEIVVDVGAHIGTFATRWNEKNPLSRIVCVEACPENHHCLSANVGSFARIYQGACTYEPGDLMLLNSIKRSGGTATGGSRVVSKEVAEEAKGTYGHLYWDDVRPLRKITLAEIMADLKVDRIDLLKLDCEGSEFSILRSQDLKRVRIIVGEYHGRERWEQLIMERFTEVDRWRWHDVRGGELGFFILENLKFGEEDDDGDDVSVDDDDETVDYSQARLNLIPRGAGLYFESYGKTSQQIAENIALGSMYHIPEMEAAGYVCLKLANDAVGEAFLPCSNGKHIPLIDGQGNNPADIRLAVSWVSEMISSGKKVFVCCRSGANRGPSILAGALKELGYFQSLVEAVTAFSTVRPQVDVIPPATLADVALVVGG